MQLSSVLRANAASCLIFGLGFAIFPASIAAFLGSAPGFLIQILGVGLVINAALLWMASLRGAKRADVLFFSLSDFTWVAATAVLIALQLWVTDPAGILAAIAAALLVGTLGLLQWQRMPT